MKRYDAIVIGTGQAGPPLARNLAGRGDLVAIAEGHVMGGSCVNYGCTPTKTLIASARVAYLARRSADFGIETGPVKVDMNVVMDRKQERVEASRSGLEESLRKPENIHVYDTFARFEGSENGLHHVRVGDAVIASERVFINTGAHAFIPPIDGLKDVNYLTNREILDLREVPQHLMILGGGYIGLELGQAFRRFGADVTIIEAAENIIMREDKDIREEVVRFFQDEGIHLKTGHKVKRVSEAIDGTITLALQSDRHGASSLKGSHLLVAVGRRPNSDNLNLESVGVEVNERGYIVTDEHLRTNINGIWALGDVNGRGAFTHTSYQDYEIVWDNLNGGSRKVTDGIMAYAVYTDPPLGRVGMSQKDARESGKNILMAVLPMSRVSRALEQSETYGMIKLLVDADSEQIIGAAVLGFHGDDVIQVISNFMYTGKSYKVMQNALPIHPTISEFLPTILARLKPIEQFER